MKSFPESLGQLKLTADRWVRALDFKPGDRRVVRAAFFSIQETGQWLGAWVPGEKMVAFPDTVAAYLPAASKVIIEIHYQAIDHDVQDCSSLGLYFTDKKPLRPLTGMGVVETAPRFVASLIASSVSGGGVTTSCTPRRTMGATATTAGHSFRIASASSAVSVVMPPAPMRVRTS